MNGRNDIIYIWNKLNYMEVRKIKIYKSYIISLNHLKQLDIDYLYSCNKESARVWNECIRLEKELWINEQKYIDRDYLQTTLKGFSEILPANCIQVTIKKYLQAIKGIQRARKVGRTDLKYPWRQKKNYNTIWKGQSVKIERNCITLGKPLDKTNNKKQKPIKIYSKYIPPNICYAEIKYDNGLKLSLNYWIDSEELQQIKSDNVSAIDLGEIHSITSVDTLGNTQIITGRKIRSYQRFRNKELGKIQKKLRKCKKDSRNYKKYRKAIVKLTSKSNTKINYELHKTSKLYKDYVVNNDIKTVIVGDLSKYNMNLKNDKNRKGSKQKLVQWQHGQLVNMLTYKLARHGVKVEEISEAYTSQICPCCGNKYKPTGRNYICKCGFKMHRDVVGAYNILSKYLNNGEIKSLDIELKPLKYLRIA